MIGVSVYRSVSPAIATRVTSGWYHAATTLWASSKLNRVGHTKPPRGEVIGRG